MVFAIDRIRLFKTSPESYGLVQQTISVSKEEVLFVSSNAWDALGATWYGFKTLWINRQNLPTEAIGQKPDYIGSDLTMVVDVLQLLKI